jgi:uncharacterized protein YjbI with pentapeptide repeats
VTQDPRTGQERAVELLRATFAIPSWLPATAASRLVWAIRCALVLGLLLLVAAAVDRSLWDWLNLLIVPAVLAIGGYLFTRFENERTNQRAESQRNLDRQIADERTQEDRQIAQQRTESDRKIADQRRQDDILQAYLDQMGLLLERGLRGSEGATEARTLARARTLTVLARLDGERKKSVLQFLYESRLIDKDSPIVNLAGADLSGLKGRRARLDGACLKGTDLSGADLSGARLEGADLGEAILAEADLKWAILDFADLHSANLNQANLSHAHLVETNLIGAELVEATLREANLRVAKLRYAILRDADLSDAEMRYCNLEVAVCSWRQLAQADSLEGTTMTDGQTLRGIDTPNGPTFEDWLKSKDRAGDGETPNRS